RHPHRLASGTPGQRCAKNGEIVCFRPTRGEENLAGVGPDGRGHLTTCLIKPGPSSASGMVRARWVTEHLLAQVREHGVPRFRADRRRGGVVEVNGWLHGVNLRGDPPSLHALPFELDYVVHDHRLEGKEGLAVPPSDKRSIVSILRFNQRVEILTGRED